MTADINTDVLVLGARPDRGVNAVPEASRHGPTDRRVQVCTRCRGVYVAGLALVMAVKPRLPSCAITPVAKGRQMPGIFVLDPKMIQLPRALGIANALMSAYWDAVRRVV